MYLNTFQNTEPLNNSRVYRKSATSAQTNGPIATSRPLFIGVDNWF